MSAFSTFKIPPPPLHKPYNIPMVLKLFLVLAFGFNDINERDNQLFSSELWTFFKASGKMAKVYHVSLRQPFSFCSSLAARQDRDRYLLYPVELLVFPLSLLQVKIRYVNS